MHTTQRLVHRLFFTISIFIFSSTSVSAQDITNSVVKVFVTSNPIDYYRPWQSKGITAGTGSGVIINEGKILTNAHVVSDQTFIQVKKNGDPKQYTAKLLAIGHDCDLALLTVLDKSFFNGTKPIELGDLPNLQDDVVVLGFPQGGDKLSITEGVVSRIEVTSYSQSARKLLTVQIDAAINPGNSGGPVMRNGKLAGIAMQILQSGQSIGYMIPVPVIKHFFDDLKDSLYQGFPILGIDYSTTENTTLRDYYKIKKEEGGVLVIKVLPYSPAAGVLEEGDVILSIDGVPIGEDGTFRFRKEERLSLTHLITQHQIADMLKLQIIREGKMQSIEIKLTEFLTLVPYPSQFEKPPYYIFGGIVFSVLSTDLLQSWGQRWWEKAPLDLNYFLIGRGRLNEEKKKEIVVILNILPDEINVGYHDSGNDIVRNVNGEEFKSFEEFVRLVHQAQTSKPYTIIETGRKAQIILKNENIDLINTEIIRRNNIPYQYSANVAQWLNQ